MGADLTLAAHFNEPDILLNPRSGEHLKFRSSGEGRLNLDLDIREPQDDANLGPLLDLALSAPYFASEDGGGFMRRNLCRQLYSLSRLKSEVDAAYPQGFDLYALVRPDLEFTTNLRPDEVQPLMEGKVDLLTPYWQTWGGFNDRFCLANRRGFELYTARERFVGPFIAEHGFIQAERLLRFSVEASGLRHGVIGTRARRVRANGRSHLEWDRLSALQRLALKARNVVRALATLPYRSPPG